MQGCWQVEDTSIEETWTRSLQGDQLFGFSVISKDGQRVFFEQLRIDLEQSGIVLSAYPKGTGPTPFKGTLGSDSAIEFANPANDYPQRIRYERAGDRLLAEISMLDGKKLSKWRYRRCQKRR